MPADPGRATRAHRTLAAELARLRALAGLSLRDLGGRGTGAAIPHARVGRIERAAAVPTRDQLLHWLATTQADEVARERVLGLFEDVYSQTQQWSAMLDDAPGRHLQALAAAREEAATGADDYCQQWLPGLLQTAPYARALFAMLERAGFNIDVETSSDRRLRRQEILHDSTRTFRFLLTRRALAWNPDPVTVSMPAQLDRIRELDSLPTTDVRVLDDDSAPVGGWSSFSLYEGEQPMVSLELEHRSLQVFDEADVAVYRRRFELMWDAGRPVGEG